MQKQKYASDQQLAVRYEVSRATVWRWARKGILPKPVSISPGCTRWELAAIEKRDAERNGQSAA